jgi:hypothetical protein
LSPDDHNSIQLASREAIRLTLLLSSKITKTPLESRSPLWLLGLKLLTDDDIQQCVLAANSLLYELELNSKRLIIANELQIMITCLKTRVKKFETIYKEMSKYSKLLKMEIKDYFEKKRQFTEILFEITHMGSPFPAFLPLYSFPLFFYLFSPLISLFFSEHEHELDVPLEYYLKDHDDLRRAHESRMKAKQSLENTNEFFKKTKGTYDSTFACLRLICLLISRCIVLYTGLHLDTTSLLTLDPETTVPSTNSLSSDINPLIYGGYSSTGSGNLKNKIQKDELISSLLTDIPWRELASLVCIERIVVGTCSIRLLGAVVCKFSDTLQWKLLPWCRRAVEDLLHEPRYALPSLPSTLAFLLSVSFDCVASWYPVTEAIPIYDAPPTQSKRELFRSLSVEEPPLPKAVYFNRLTSLDTRVSCAIAYWSTRGNTSILNECSRWMDTTAYQQDLEDIQEDKRTGEHLTSKDKYLVWVRLLMSSERKSEIVENEQEYYATNDPSRQFREMELKSLASKELVINEEFEEEDDGSDDSESEEESEEDSEEEGEEEGDGLSMNSSLGNHRKISLKPKHKKIFQQMIDDRFAMALLHLSASDFFDDTYPSAAPPAAAAPPVVPASVSSLDPSGIDGIAAGDSNLYHESQKICQRSLSPALLCSLLLSFLLSNLFSDL